MSPRILRIQAGQTHDVPHPPHPAQGVIENLFEGPRGLLIADLSDPSHVKCYRSGQQSFRYGLQLAEMETGHRFADGATPTCLPWSAASSTPYSVPPQPKL